MSGRQKLAGFVLVVGLLAGRAVMAGPLPSGIGEQVGALLADAGVAWPVEAVTFEGGALAVCLRVPVNVLQADHGSGAEALQHAVRTALTPVDWRTLAVQARDPGDGRCRPLSSYLSQPRAIADVTQDPGSYLAPVRTDPEFPRSLEGKTVYVSAGHGWQWSDYWENWRTQRIVYQGFIEDHNNAEAVDQYLIPYLENAGATVIPVRERDWNAARVIVDNDDGAPAYIEAGSWFTSSLAGYNGSTYRYAVTVSGTATATATWQLTVPQTGTYALYAWVYPGGNRTPDAAYTVRHAGGTSEVRIDQRIRQQTWRYLGTFPFYAGAARVTLDNGSAVAGGTAVIADALRLGGGSFDSLDGIATDALFPPDRPWWESAAYYYSQWMGLNPDDWDYYNDVVSRPIFSRWNHAGSGDDAVYISWHTNGYNGTAWGTESYVHDGETYSRTLGSLELQTAVHDELIHDLRAGWDAGWTDRGKKQTNLGELRMLWDDDPAVRMPGMLLELAFHDHPEDAKALKDPRFNQLAARAIYQGVVAYFENRDGIDLVTAPEPPVQARVQNAGNGAVQVAWSPSPTDTVGLLGEAATAYRVYTSPDGFAWSAPVAVTETAYTIGGLASGETLYVRVTAVNEGGESFPTEVLGARVGTPPLLIVNGFDKLRYSEVVDEPDPVEGWNERMWIAQMNDRAYVLQHGGAVPVNYAWDSASNEAVMDGAVTLTDYAIVDWLLGEESDVVEGAFDAAERAVVTAYLDSGHALLVSGSEFARDLAVRASTFLTGVLHTNYVTDTSQTFDVTAVSGGVFDGLADFTFNGGGEYLADAPDVISPTRTASEALRYAGGAGGVAAVAYADGCRRSLTFGFPLEVVPPESRTALMSRALAYLGHCVSATVTITTPQAGSTYSVTPAFAGIAAGAALSDVNVLVQRDSDGLYWDGGGWAGETWLLATGVESWHYLLPVLLDGGYTLHARSVSAQSASAADVVTFTLDTTAPLTPALITPTGGLVVDTSVITFAWDAPDDAGVPLTYHLAVGSRVYATSATTYAVTLPDDVYAWRVRTVDAAGNVGPWSEEETFTIYHVPLTVTILTPQAGAYYSATPAFSGSAAGSGLDDVMVQVRRDHDGTYWDASGWSDEIWLAASGVESWTYVLPSLADGSYTLWAQASDGQSVSIPAVVTFAMDVTAPLTPTLITPTGGVLLPAPVVTFEWESLIDAGTPLTYHLAVGSEVFEASVPTFSMPLFGKAYTWRVRAVDAVGNVGPWSEEAAFAVDVKQVFLPLVLR